MLGGVSETEILSSSLERGGSLRPRQRDHEVAQKRADVDESVAKQALRLAKRTRETPGRTSPTGRLRRAMRVCRAVCRLARVDDYDELRARLTERR